MLWPILIQFLFRLSFGLALAMSVTSAKLVTAGFFRVHLWVGLGLNTFAAAIMMLVPDFPQVAWMVGIATLGAVASYVGAVTWLYERERFGRVVLVAVALINLGGSLALTFAYASPRSTDWQFMAGAAVDTITAGALLGATFTAMLLGHWYLNTPTMKLAPLRRLVLLMAAAALIRASVSISGLQGAAELLTSRQSTQLALLSLRWLAGLVGVLAMTAMTWQTLKIPNTQSATGILYVAVIFVFLGELTAQLISASPAVPV